MSELWPAFLAHRGHLAHKWAHYFPIYEQHFGRFRNRPVLLLEIGVGGGGSLQLWKGYLGPLAQIVGIDIEDKREAQEEQISVLKGSQADPEFLQGVLTEFGQPDIIIDDGSHVMGDIVASFEFLYPRMSPNGVYVVEDLHTAYWDEYGGGLKAPGSFIELTKDLIDQLNAHHTRGALEPSTFTRSTLSIHIHDSVVVFERAREVRKYAPMIGGSQEATDGPSLS